MDEKLQETFDALGLEVKQKNNVYQVSKLIAERKAFLSKKKLTYNAKVTLDDDSKKLTFTEYLKESGSGLSSGGDFDSNMSPGFGFSKTSYKTGTGGISGTIEEQSNLFGKQYNYQFKYQEVREAIEDVAKKNGYSFDYKIFS